MKFDRNNIKLWLMKETDNNISNYQFIDELFQEILLFMESNNLICTTNEGKLKMKFIKFLYKYSDHPEIHSKLQMYSKYNKLDYSYMRI